ncbi:tetratricopeptide repeat protein [Bilophila wadsworthia]|uniref:tetratricopeptide repeat protein n=1 Tax=Bilophila wadsworthia TaxID=35833 RepID=UPI00242D89AE|nr:hypothetical protein [Bilophila wadsworthia]
MEKIIKYFLTVSCILLLPLNSLASSNHAVMVQQAMEDLGIPHAGEFEQMLEDKNPIMTVGVASTYLSYNQCEKGKYWLETIKKKNDIEYNDILGLLYLNGDCGPQDIQYAQALFKKSAKKSYICKEHLLSAYIIDTRADPKARFLLAKELASYGNELAFYTVAESYAQGMGVVRDFEQAYMWSLVGMSRVGSPEQRRIYQTMANALERVLTASQRNKQKSKAESWKAKPIPSNIASSTFNVSYGVNPNIYNTYDTKNQNTPKELSDEDIFLKDFNHCLNSVNEMFLGNNAENVAVHKMRYLYSCMKHRGYSGSQHEIMKRASDLMTDRIGSNLAR